MAHSLVGLNNVVSLNILSCFAASVACITTCYLRKRTNLTLFPKCTSVRALSLQRPSTLSLPHRFDVLQSAFIFTFHIFFFKIIKQTRMQHYRSSYRLICYLITRRAVPSIRRFHNYILELWSSAPTVILLLIMLMSYFTPGSASFISVPG